MTVALVILAVILFLLWKDRQARRRMEDRAENLERSRIPDCASEKNMNRREVSHQPPQEFVNGILIQEYLKLHPLTAEQIEKNRQEFLRDCLGRS
jgi:hypothetical protein